jgi:hypothetical protein
MAVVANQVGSFSVRPLQLPDDAKKAAIDAE